MIIPFNNIVFLKEFLAFNGCFRIFTKIKKSLGLAFDKFFAWFFHKNVPYLISYQWTTFQCHSLFPSQDIKQNIFRLLLTLWTLRLILDQPLKQWLTGRKSGNMEIQKFEYLESKKSFLDGIKNICHSFWRAIIWWKRKICYKIADTSFKFKFYLWNLIYRDHKDRNCMSQVLLI